MEFRAPPSVSVEANVNVTKVNPLSELVTLLGGSFVVIVSVLGVSFFLLDRALPLLPEKTEAAFFATTKEVFALEKSLGGVESTGDDVKSCVVRVVDKLRPAYGSTAFPLDVFVIPDEDPNAFTFPGGHIGVTLGLLREIKSENALAFVLGHELAHVRYRDAVRRLGRSVIAAVFLSAVTGTTVSETTLAQTTSLVMLAYSRSDENDADSLALDLVAKTYRHVSGAFAFFENRVVDEKYERTTPAFMSTHPVTDERIRGLHTLARERGVPTEGETTPFDCPALVSTELAENAADDVDVAIPK